MICFENGITYPDARMAAGMTYQEIQDIRGDIQIKYNDTSGFRNDISRYWNGTFIQMPE
jgi:hypothetical protein